MVTIYTDGAASNNGYDNAVGGYGLVIEMRGESPLVFGGKKPNATNNEMELTAMVSALSWLEGYISRGGYKLDENEQIFVYTDSAYIANCYSQKWYTNWEINGWKNSKRQEVANKELWKTLIPFFKKDNIHIVKVKGHSENLGNKIADQVAVAARTMEDTEFTTFRVNLMDKLEKIQ